VPGRVNPRPGRQRGAQWGQQVVERQGHYRSAQWWGVCLVKCGFGLLPQPHRVKPDSSNGPLTVAGGIAGALHRSLNDQRHSEVLIGAH
jgi:hypothetical protein